MVLDLLLTCMAAAALAAFWIWARQSRCPHCRHRSVTRLDDRLLLPRLYCVLCRFDWVPTLMAAPRRHT
jgi:hypothetical protein